MNLIIPIILAGTFGELRPNHFHAGIDIKTKGTEGFKVYSIGDGYVSRIQITHGGYGKALYIKHDNGQSSVYAHLQKFSPKIEAFVKALQYEKESFEIQTFPKSTELVLEKGELIGYSGNTGNYKLAMGTLPEIIGSAIAPDDSYLEIQFSEGMYTDATGNGALEVSDFEISFDQNGGTADGVSSDYSCIM